MKLVFGAGGVARELLWLLSSFEAAPAPSVVITPAPAPSRLPSDECTWLAEEDAISRFDRVAADAYIAVGDGRVRRKIHERTRHAAWRFPSIVHSAASLDRRPRAVRIGEGSLVYPLASLTTDIDIGAFVQINPGSTIGHGARVGSYVTVCPGAHVSGGATIGSATFLGAGCVIREGVRIAADCIIGAGAVVTGDIDVAGTWIGVPARRLDRP
jgi:sugar O-acyltransferase (sialic acid O-acetyltransferase NeuD family)